MRSALLSAVITACALASGCASVMRDAPTQQVSPAGADKVKIVFMRSSLVAAAIGCELFEVVDGELRFIGQLPNGSKVAYETTPGKKVFMAYGTAADFMLADIGPGKIYYSIVRPNWGTGGFAPTPIRNARDTEAQGWISGTKLIEPSPKEADAWFAENKQRLQGIYTDYWNRFQNKSIAEKADRTLNTADGQ